MSSSVSFTDNINAFNSFMNTMGQVMGKVKNVRYIPSTNLTAIAGVVNCEDLRVLGQEVGLKNHTHSLDEVVFEYEEEETFEEETVNEEEETIIETRTRTITKQKGLDELLDEKADVGHTHSLSDITDIH